MISASIVPVVSSKLIEELSCNLSIHLGPLVSTRVWEGSGFSEELTLTAGEAASYTSIAR